VKNLVILSLLAKQINKTLLNEYYYFQIVELRSNYFFHKAMSDETLAVRDGVEDIEIVYSQKQKNYFGIFFPT
jgi:hypothetical protein